MIFREPVLAMEWLCAGDTMESYKIYKDKFKASKLFPKDDTSLQRLYKDYDHCSKQLHNSIYSFARRLDTSSKEDSFSMSIQYFEFSKEHPGEPARTLLFTVITHFRILEVFAELFEGEIEQNKIKWSINYNAVEGKYNVHSSRWKKIFEKI